jgi:hypothetical protein
MKPEITDAMIEAGLVVLEESGRLQFDRRTSGDDVLVQRVYRAMGEADMSGSPTDEAREGLIADLKAAALRCKDGKTALLLCEAVGALLSREQEPARDGMREALLLWWRLVLVIESAVRRADGPINHEAVLTAIRCTQELVKSGVLSVPPSSPQESGHEHRCGQRHG